MSIKDKHARNLTIMLTAGASLDSILAMAKLYRIQPIDIHNLDLPQEEIVAKNIIITALQNGIQ